jgi:hypothetical protein
MSTKVWGVLGPDPERLRKPDPIEAKTPDDWYMFLYAILRSDEVRSRWFVPDPQTFH